MKTLKEFETEIRERENLLKNILIHKRDYEFLSTPGEARLISFFYQRPLFIRAKDTTFKLLCIEVHKLFSDLKGDKFKLTQLLHKIKEHREDSEWKKKLKMDDIKKLNRLINKGLENKALKGLRNYRNKYLAHTDNDKSESTFFQVQFYQLIDIAVQIIDFLRRKILDERISLEFFIPTDGFASIRSLAKD